jgi:hypothetical protein
VRGFIPVIEDDTCHPVLNISTTTPVVKLVIDQKTSSYIAKEKGKQAGKEENNFLKKGREG